MKSTPVYVFENESSVGIDIVPISAFVMIREINPKLEPMILTKVSNNGMSSASTILDFLNDDTLYDAFKADSELERIDAITTDVPAWRILGRNPINYNAGDGSIDFSVSTNSMPTKGAQGYRSFAEGENTLASGAYSHAEGFSTTASGAYSHAEGKDTVASLEGSHAGGLGNTTNLSCSAYATVFGKWSGSVRKGSKNVLEVGWGNDDANRNNIFEIDTCGLGDGPELRAPMTEIKDIVHNRSLVTKEYLTSLLDTLWLGDLVDVTAIPPAGNVTGTAKFQYTGSTYYKYGDIIADPGGVVWRCITRPGYTSSGDQNAKPPTGGTQGDFNAEQVVNWGPIINNQIAAQNHLVVYNPLGGTITPGSGSTPPTGCWENVQDLDMGYYHP